MRLLKIIQRYTYFKLFQFSILLLRAENWLFLVLMNKHNGGPGLLKLATCVYNMYNIFHNDKYIE